MDANPVATIGHNGGPVLADDEELLTSKEQAQFLRCTVRTLDQRAIDGDGPPYLEFGNKRLYPKSWTKLWLAGRRRTSTAA